MSHWKEIKIWVECNSPSNIYVVLYIYSVHVCMLMACCSEIKAEPDVLILHLVLEKIRRVRLVWNWEFIKCLQFMERFQLDTILD